MKKLGSLIIMAMILATSIMPVQALKNSTSYFTNMNGVELTQEQYNNLLKGFSYDTINTMSQEMIDFLKNDTNIQKITTTKYVKTSTRYVNSESISTLEEEVGKLEFENSPEKSIISSKFAANDYVETNYKKITFDVTFGASISTKYVTLTNVWKQIPVTKSFDVLAISVGVPSISFNLGGHRSGYQKWDGNTINYDANSGNWKIVDSSTIWKKGLGLSQNIVDDTKSTLSNSITVVFLSGALPFPVRASYQHATSDVSLSQSKDYTLGTDGMGNLIKFSSSVWNKYDNTPGLYAELNL